MFFLWSGCFLLMNWTTFIYLAWSIVHRLGTLMTLNIYKRYDPTGVGLTSVVISICSLALSLLDYAPYMLSSKSMFSASNTLL